MRLPLTIVVLLLATAAFAQDEEVDCKNPITQQDMNVCAANDAADADAEMNKVWKKARQYTVHKDKDFQEVGDQPGMEKALLATQRSWITFRDANCEVAGYTVHGGSMEPMVIEGCLAEMTRLRTKQLNDMMEGVP